MHLWPREIYFLMNFRKFSTGLGSTASINALSKSSSHLRVTAWLPLWKKQKLRRAKSGGCSDVDARNSLIVASLRAEVLWCIFLPLQSGPCSRVLSRCQRPLADDVLRTWNSILAVHSYFLDEASEVGENGGYCQKSNEHVFECPSGVLGAQNFLNLSAEWNAADVQVRVIQGTWSIMFCTTAIFSFVTAVAGLPLRGTSYSFAGMHVAIEARDWCMERWMVPDLVYNDDQLMLHAVPAKQPLDLLHDSDCCQTKSRKMITPVWWTVIMKSAYSDCKNIMNKTFMWYMKSVQWQVFFTCLSKFAKENLNVCFNYFCPAGSQPMLYCCREGEYRLFEGVRLLIESRVWMWLSVRVHRD